MFILDAVYALAFYTKRQRDPCGALPDNLDTFFLPMRELSYGSTNVTERLAR